MKLRLISWMAAGLLAAAPVFAGEGEGTTIVGEREAAVGLYLLPWREEAPSAIDRPPRPLMDAPAPLDAAAFARRVDSDEAEAAYRRVRVEPRTF